MTRRCRATLTGPLPRPEALVQATRDLDRGRITPEAGAAAFAAAERQARKLEAELALDGRTGGLLRWADLLRPFTTGWTGVSAGPLTRFFETNTFYRQPVLAAPPGPGELRLADWVPTGEAARAVLPGPYTFASLAQVGYRPAAGRSVVEDIADALAESLRSLGGARPAQVQFQEPMLVVRPPGAAWESVLRAYQALGTACGGSETSVWTYFGDAGPVLSLLAELPVGCVGFDAFVTTVPAGVAWAGKALGLGCLDPTTTIAEEPAEVLRIARRAVDALGATDVWVGPNPPFDLLPFEAARTKAEHLPALREALGR
jgi:5-methyltetrahydropteroyltriglutamate--homocysteine methyltransferase